MNLLLNTFDTAWSRDFELDDIC